MSSIFYVIFCVALAWIAFNAVYFGCVDHCLQTKIKYRLFALRDRLRRLRIDNPSLDDQIYEMMELRINGSIGLVTEVSFHRLVFAHFADYYSQEEKKQAMEMEIAIRGFFDKRGTELEEQLYDVETQTMGALYDAFSYNSPFFSVLMFFVTRFGRHISRWYKKWEEYMLKPLPAMMVRAATLTGAISISLKP
jgi:hypothetical protein